MPITVVFILSAKHSGSTWLNLVLGSLGWTVNLGEYYRPFLLDSPVACRLCQADGLPDCSLLHGIGEVRVEDAFHFAAQRSDRSVIIDSSKSLDWTERFLGREDIDVRLVHLIRHPAGVAESIVRRDPTYPLDKIIRNWREENRRIEAFTAAASAPGRQVAYESLTEAPDAHFPDLCGFIGGPWNAAAIRYWETPHHGMGGNGANSVYLKGREVRTYSTFDDAFYADIDKRPLAADSRWKARFSSEDQARFVADAYFQEVKARLSPVGW